MNWHLLNTRETAELLGARTTGLTAEEVEDRVLQYGPNQLAEKKKRSLWKLFAAQFGNVMILILLAAALISGLIGEIKDTLVILVIFGLNAVVGFVQEYRAEKAMELLKKLAPAVARIRRNGAVFQIPASGLVPGDVVLLEAGDLVPADIRLTEAHALKIDESSLTGESVPAVKHTRELKEEHAPLGDRSNMAYKTTLVTAGRGTGYATATGMQTEIGSIALMLQESESTTPLQRRMADFGKKLSWVILAICLVLLGLGLLRGEEPMKMLLTAISLAVAAIPEALPAVITIALALGARKLVRKNALIRRLPAVETLGSVTYICTDKTGTLTLNKMEVREVWASDAESIRLLLLMTLNNDTQPGQNGDLSGDPTELALARFALDQPMHSTDWPAAYPRVGEAPFDADRKMMSTVHKTPDGNYLVAVKGAMEAVLDRCTDTGREDILSKGEQMAAQGMRVLAFGYKTLSDLPDGEDHLEEDLRFCGLVGLIDPPRPEVAKAVRECRAAGIFPVMITGDHPVTARAIAQEIGILADETDLLVTGEELDKMPREVFEQQVRRIRVYARVSPRQKLDIVKALQAQGQYIAMTGDGVNDAPALRTSDIGVAMGITGTDVSKEAAHLILLDDDFGTIVKAIREGRRIYDNIRKFIRYIMTGNSGELWVILLAPLAGLPIPLLPIQILWINLVTDGLPGLALAGERAERDVMSRPPRPPGESLFARGLGRHILWVGLLMGAVCLGVQAWAIHTGNPRWQTMVFTVLTFSQMGHVLAVRSERFFLFRQGLFSNPALMGAVLLTAALQLAIIYVPFLQDIFSTQALTLKELVICVAASSVVFHGVEGEKSLMVKFSHPIL
ncbi:MAG TPA: cation-translocating P-type ATPase [Flavilitoribacter sp.]|nr:cation-translocating P-type ATPase [Flavilitoribacter sp.]